MTPSQKACLDYICNHCKLFGCAPTFDDMRVALGYSSKSSVARLVDELVSQGYLERPGGHCSRRNLVVVERGGLRERLQAMIGRFGREAVLQAIVDLRPVEECLSEAVPALANESEGMRATFGCVGGGS